MLGAIIGDMVGCPYEFDHNNIKTKDFPLFTSRSQFTDDSIMTLAVAQGIMLGKKNKTATKTAITLEMQELGQAYPDGGYGARFGGWLYSDDPKPYSSFGNGSAMRVSSVGWAFDTETDVLDYAKISAEITHNHPEGIKGAQSTALAIWLARNGADKATIKSEITDRFGYDLNRTCDAIRPTYHHVESCQETVPEAIIAFLEGQDFEDVLRTGVSLGGDSDTLTAIAASIGEAYFGIPDDIAAEGLSRLDSRLRGIYEAFILWNTPASDD